MSCLSSKFLTIGFALGTVVLASTGEAADPIRTLFLESCSTREAESRRVNAPWPWIELFCQREAELRFARFVVAEAQDQRLILEEDCVLQEMLGLWRAPIEFAISVKEFRAAVRRSCGARAERLLAPVEAPPVQLVEEIVGDACWDPITGAADYRESLQLLGRSADAGRIALDYRLSR